MLEDDAETTQATETRRTAGREQMEV